MMVYYDHRMVEGSPLQYRYEVANPIGSEFPFFSRFELGRRSMMSEELMVPNSPNSTQSDSENSISSIDVIPEPIQRSKIANNPSGKKSDAQCCWRSCGVVFQSLDQLSDHVSKVHATSGLGGLYYCGWEGCARNNKGFNARYKMLVHVRTHTNEKPHQCAQCQKSFSRAENLKIHSRSHSGEKPYACPVPGCTKAYSNSSDRFKHTRTHQVDKPYQCKVAGCPKRYTDPSSLRKHVKTYKHFVENNRTNENESERMAEVEATRPVESSQNQACTCNHSCQLAKSLDALMNFRGDDIKPWNDVIERRIYVTYDLNEHMDVDLPLDLSVARKHI